MALKRPYEAATKTAGDLTSLYKFLIDKSGDPTVSNITAGELILYIAANIIKDADNTGTAATWSIDKIKAEILSAIDDESTSASLTWSSTKISNEIADAISSLVDSALGDDANFASTVTAALAGKEATANKGVANGYASLDSEGDVPATQIKFGTTAETVAEGNDSRFGVENFIKNPSYFTDFYTSAGDWQNGSSGGNITGLTGANSGSLGTVVLNAATVSHRASIFLNGLNFAFVIGAGFPFMFFTSLKLLVLSTTIDEFEVHGGLKDVLAGDGTNGVYFRYNRSVDGNFWSCVTRKSSIETKTVTTVALVADSVYKLKAEINGAGTEVLFYINSVLVATHTTNIPTGSSNTALPQLTLNKLVGSTGVVAIFDYWGHAATISTR